MFPLIQEMMAVPRYSFSFEVEDEGIWAFIDGFWDDAGSWDDNTLFPE